MATGRPCNGPVPAMTPASQLSSRLWTGEESCHPLLVVSVCRPMSCKQDMHAINNTIPCCGLTFQGYILVLNLQLFESTLCLASAAAAQSLCCLALVSTFVNELSALSMFLLNLAVARVCTRTSTATKGARVNNYNSVELGFESTLVEALHQNHLCSFLLCLVTSHCFLCACETRLVSILWLPTLTCVCCCCCCCVLQVVLR